MNSSSLTVKAMVKGLFDADAEGINTRFDSVSRIVEGLLFSASPVGLGR